MKLTDAQIEIVNNFIDERHINKQRLIEYLEKHATVKNNVFQFCAVRQGKRHTLIDDDYCIFMDDERGFCPVPRDVFIRRIPFLFSLSSIMYSIILQVVRTFHLMRFGRC